jgi:hypothetical protein
MTRAKVIATGGVILHVNGQAYGRVAEFRFNVASPRKAIYGIDCSQPFELAPTTTRVSGTLKIYRTVGDGGAEGANMMGTGRKINREKYFKLALLEKMSDTVIFRADYCSVTSQSWDVPSKGIITGTIEFEALDFSNEVEN